MRLCSSISVSLKCDVDFFRCFISKQCNFNVNGNKPNLNIQTKTVLAEIEKNVVQILQKEQVWMKNGSNVLQKSKGTLFWT